MLAEIVAIVVFSAGTGNVLMSGPQQSSETLRVTRPTAREIVLTRIFEAPRKMVFDALTTPDLIRRWFELPGWTLLDCKIDLRAGGAWRYVLRRPDGANMEMRGVYREVVPPERLVNTETYDIYTLELLVTTVLTENGGRTTLTVHILYPSEKARDEDYPAAVPAARAAYDKLAAYLASTK